MSNSPGLRKRILLNLHRNFVANETKLHELSYIFWECTLRCNLNCRHCGSDCRTDSLVKDMPLDDFISVATSIKKKLKIAPNTIVVLTGGEPLLRDDIEECGNQLRRLGYRWGMVSNGEIYTAARHDTLMKAGMGSLTISLDGMREKHNWLRNSPNSFDKVSNALNIISKDKRLNSDVVTCVNPQNINELDEIKDFLCSKQIKSWRLFTIAPIGRANKNSKLLLSGAQMKMLMEFIKKERKSKKIDVKFSCEGYVGKYENSVREGFFFCRAGINIGSVLCDGTISACPNIDRAFAQGNIYVDDFAEVWNNRFELMRNREWTKKGKCADCQSYNWCKGNGFHLREPGKNEPLVCHHQMLDDIF